LENLRRSAKKFGELLTAWVEEGDISLPVCIIYRPKYRQRTSLQCLTKVNLTEDISMDFRNANLALSLTSAYSAFNVNYPLEG
jgi:hypothetical protein